MTAFGEAGGVRSMRAARITSPRSIAIERVPVPEPSGGQVRVRIEGCGICGSNLEPWLGKASLRYPLSPGEGGHEAWGVVDALGPSATGVRVGDRVAMISYRGF